MYETARGTRHAARSTIAITQHHSRAHKCAHIGCGASVHGAPRNFHHRPIYCHVRRPLWKPRHGRSVRGGAPRPLPRTPTTLAPTHGPIPRCKCVEVICWEIAGSGAHSSQRVQMSTKLCDSAAKVGDSLAVRSPAPIAPKERVELSGVIWKCVHIVEGDCHRRSTRRFEGGAVTIRCNGSDACASRLVSMLDSRRCTRARTCRGFAAARSRVMLRRMVPTFHAQARTHLHHTTIT